MQTAIIMLATSLYASRQHDELVRTAADCICQDFTRQLTGRRPDDRYLRIITKHGEQIADGGFTPIVGVQPVEIMMRYEG